MASQEGYIENANQVAHPFGRIYEIIGNGKFNVARAIITDDKEHYHKKATEVYYVLSGKGLMKIGDRTIELKPHTSVIIEPLTRHRATAEKGDKLDLIVFSSPPYDSEDEFQ